MNRVAIKFGTISGKGDHPQTGGARLVNAIVSQIEDGRTIITRAPGLSRFAQSIGGYSHCRSMIAANDSTLLTLYDDHVESITLTAGAYVSEVRGSLTGTDLVTLARNNNTTPDVVGVSPSQGAFTLAAAGAPASYPDADVQSPISVCFTGGYFFFAYGDGRCRASGLNSTAINSLDEAKAESRSDGLLRCVAFRGQLFLCGPSTIEVWQGDQPNASGFPFNRSTVIQRGLAGTNAIAGWEDKFASVLCWAGSDNIVYQLNGYEPTRISTPTIERDLQALTDKSNLRCFVAAHDGHPYFYLKSDAFTHAYDLLTSTWQERKSYGYERFRAEQSVHIFGDWLLGDEFSGDLHRLDALTDFEADQPLVFDVESETTDNFPQRPAVKRADFHFVGGAARSSGNDPQVMISWSNNGGRDFGTPLMRSLGKIGEYNNLVTVKRCAVMNSGGRKWRLQVSDAGYVGLLGGVMWLG